MPGFFFSGFLQSGGARELSPHCRKYRIGVFKKTRITWFDHSEKSVPFLNGTADEIKGSDPPLKHTFTFCRGGCPIQQAGVPRTAPNSWSNHESEHAVFTFPGVERGK